ncbi:helix-turn-helix domain-containing protein [Gloeothece verrucosa]|uniref:Transcriptional regulator, XRE family n=1 Tax=Gloeothece verrucosa (strain PCC 7822) TaxID=497965 RepID=E0UCF8_GLOV7|nr:helix-turn-helix domain-containing protein [Gloeothece verrucosa]ADN14029.1 transcriptional regulator, XRE family [Gloeothece verrucosa PCC 7822]
MTQNNNNDVLAFLDDIIPDTPENRLIERQELFRIALTQGMRNLRKRVGMTQKELAQKLGVTQGWVSKLESANNDHTFASVLAYLDGLAADFEAAILLNDQKFQVIPAYLRKEQEEIEGAITSVLNPPENLSSTPASKPPEFPSISPEQKRQCEEVKEIIKKTHSLWGIAS